MGDAGQQDSRVGQAGALLRAVALYRVCVGDVIDLRSEQTALHNRLKQLPAEIDEAERREAQARVMLLQAARGAHGQETPNLLAEVEAEVARGREKLNGD